MTVHRREFLKLAGLAAGGFCLAGFPTWALPQQQGRALRVTILGAGLAGLSAGWELKRTGHDVTILEAQTHPGGRVHTIREGLSDDMYAEAGAGRIPNTHKITLEWVNHFGLRVGAVLPQRAFRTSRC